MMFGVELTAAAVQLLEQCRRRKLRLATAESCTGGLAAGLLTSVAGSSDVFEAGLVTYSNDAKSRLIGVPADLIQKHGAVSEEVALAMAELMLVAVPQSDIALSVTGIAGPGGGSAAKPVGLVHIAAARRGHPAVQRRLQLGDIGRETIRLRSLEVAIELGLLQAAAEP
jgi:nicotinamide-nucleotide amidase